MLKLVFNVSAQFFPRNTHSSFSGILAEQLNPKGQREVPISEFLQLSKHQSSQGSYTFSTQNMVRKKLYSTWSRLLLQTSSITEPQTRSLEKKGVTLKVL